MFGIRHFDFFQLYPSIFCLYFDVIENESGQSYWKFNDYNEQLDVREETVENFTACRSPPIRPVWSRAVIGARLAT